MPMILFTATARQRAPREQDTGEKDQESWEFHIGTLIALRTPFVKQSVDAPAELGYVASDIFTNPLNPRFLSGPVKA